MCTLFKVGLALVAVLRGTFKVTCSLMLIIFTIELALWAVLVLQNVMQLNYHIKLGPCMGRLGMGTLDYMISVQDAFKTLLGMVWNWRRIIGPDLWSMDGAGRGFHERQKGTTRPSCIFNPLAVCGCATSFHPIHERYQWSCWMVVGINFERGQGVLWKMEGQHTSAAHPDLSQIAGRPLWA